MNKKIKALTSKKYPSSKPSVKLTLPKTRVASKPKIKLKPTYKIPRKPSSGIGVGY